jgi:hypothetical protein
MLADFPHISPRTGFLSVDLHLPATSLHALLDFIAGELPTWRDRADRRRETTETVLTSQLCAHLNSAARCSIGWDFLQFRPEEPDVHNRGRRIDLVPAPCGTTVWINGRLHADFDPLLPIECKRLPTPTEKDRDEREYVISGQATTGGMQRFKEGHHGAAHSLCAMIAYVQKNTRAFWCTCISQWIAELAEAGQAGWSQKDMIHLDRDDDAKGMAVLHSSHTRAKGLPDIDMRHFWVQMN